MELKADRVEEIFMECLFKDGELTESHIKAEGILNTVGFHPERLEGHKPEIAAMLNELPESFHRNTGGGMSFLAACDDKHGNQWTGLHMRMDQLFQLGIAAGYAKSLLPREMWSRLPGGMPYYVVDEPGCGRLGG